MADEKPVEPRPAGSGAEAPSATLQFFGLREHPFAPTADPAYFYASAHHKECLHRLWDNVDERMGIAVVLGNYGTGKTTLLRKLLTGMQADPGKYCTAVIGSPVPSWSSYELLDAIVAQFGLQPAEATFVACMEALNRHLLANRHRVCTLVIDDAQNLNRRGQIELLRLIQNLETEQHKLLNLMFFAQLEWAQVLRAAPNFEQRVNLTLTMQPLTIEEMEYLIDFRLMQAGAVPGTGPAFTPAALRAIHAYSEGSPRVIVTLCRNVLLIAAQLRERAITQEMVLHTIDKTTLPDPARRARLNALLRGDAPAPAPAGKPEAPAARPEAPAAVVELLPRAVPAAVSPKLAVPASAVAPGLAAPPGAPAAGGPPAQTHEQRAAQMLQRAREARNAGNA